MLPILGFLWLAWVFFRVLNFTSLVFFLLGSLAISFVIKQMTDAITIHRRLYEITSIPRMDKSMLKEEVSPFEYGGPEWSQLTGYPEINQRVEKLWTIIKEDYIYSWFVPIVHDPDFKKFYNENIKVKGLAEILVSKLVDKDFYMASQNRNSADDRVPFPSPDKTKLHSRFIKSLDEKLFLISKTVVKFLSNNVDIVEFTSAKLLPMLLRHIQNYKRGNNMEALKRNSPVSKNSRSSLMFETSDDIYQHSHPAISVSENADGNSMLPSAQAEMKYWRHVLDTELLPLLLQDVPTSDTPIIKFIVREILTTCVLYPMIESLASPDYWNWTLDIVVGGLISEQMVVTRMREVLERKSSDMSLGLNGKSGGIGQKKKSQKGVPTFEQYLDMISSCSSADDGIMIRNRLLQEIEKIKSSMNDAQAQHQSKKFKSNMEFYVNRLYLAKKRLDKRITELGGILDDDPKSLMTAISHDSSTSIDNPTALAEQKIQTEEYRNPELAETEHQISEKFLYHILTNNPGLFYFKEFLRSLKMQRKKTQETKNIHSDCVGLLKFWISIHLMLREFCSEIHPDKNLTRLTRSQVTESRQSVAEISSWLVQNSGSIQASNLSKRAYEKIYQICAATGEFNLSQNSNHYKSSGLLYHVLGDIGAQVQQLLESLSVQYGSSTTQNQGQLATTFLGPVVQLLTVISQAQKLVFDHMLTNVLSEFMQTEYYFRYLGDGGMSAEMIDSFIMTNLLTSNESLTNKSQKDVETESLTVAEQTANRFPDTPSDQWAASSKKPITVGNGIADERLEIFSAPTESKQNEQESKTMVTNDENDDNVGGIDVEYRTEELHDDGERDAIESMAHEFQTIIEQTKDEGSSAENFAPFSDDDDDDTDDGFVTDEQGKVQISNETSSSSYSDDDDDDDDNNNSTNNNDDVSTLLSGPDLSPRSSLTQKPSSSNLDNNIHYQLGQQSPSSSQIDEPLQERSKLLISEELKTIKQKIERLNGQENLLDLMIEKIKSENVENKIIGRELKLMNKMKYQFQHERQTLDWKKSQLELQASDNLIWPGKTRLSIPSYSHVHEPSNVSTGGSAFNKSSFVVYLIEVDQQNVPNSAAVSWMIARRYSEFHTMNKRLKKRYPLIMNQPGFELPGKRYFHFTTLKAPLSTLGSQSSINSTNKQNMSLLDRKEHEFMEERRLALEVYLRNICNHEQIAQSLELRQFLCQERFLMEPSTGTQPSKPKNLVPKLVSQIPNIPLQAASSVKKLLFQSSASIIRPISHQIINPPKNKQTAWHSKRKSLSIFETNLKNQNHQMESNDQTTASSKSTPGTHVDTKKTQTTSNQHKSPSTETASSEQHPGEMKVAEGVVTQSANENPTSQQQLADTGANNNQIGITEYLCDIFLELFELKEKNNWLRKQAVLIILQQIFGGTIERHVTDAAKWLSGSEMICWYIDKLIEMLLQLQQAEHTTERTPTDKEQTKLNAYRKLHLYLPDVLGSMTGRGNAKRGSTRIFQLVQSEKMNKELLYRVVDSILEALVGAGAGAAGDGGGG